MRKSVYFAFLVAVVMAGCRNQSALSPSEAKTLDPSGQWTREDGLPLDLVISHDPRGAWIVESLGKPSRGQVENACWRVYAGSLIGAQLVATSDVNRDFKGVLTRTELAPYNGLFLEFKRGFVTVSGPESRAEECPLQGDYVRKSAKLSTSRDFLLFPGPIVGDPYPATSRPAGSGTQSKVAE